MSGIPVKWFVVPATHGEPVGAEAMYTSKEPPVENDEYERVLAQLSAATARAEAAEANGKELLDAFSRLQAEHSELIERERLLERDIVSLRETVHIAREAFGEIPTEAIREIIDAAKEAYPRGTEGMEMRETCAHVGAWLDIVERYEPEKVQP